MKTKGVEQLEMWFPERWDCAGKESLAQGTGEKKFLILNGASVTSLSISYPWRTDNKTVVSKAPLE